MRGIPSAAFFIFLGIIILIEVIAYLSIMQIVKKSRKKKLIAFSYWILSACFISIWLTAFLNPETIRETENYQFFYLVISLTTLNIIPKIILNCFFVISIVPLIFKVKHISKLIVMSGLIISIGTLLTIGTGIAWERKMLRIEKVEIPMKNLPSQLNGIKIVQISDIHLGSFTNDQFLKESVAAINKLSPDLILFTGDIVNNYYSEIIGFEEELTRMNASLGKYAILGNHDYGDYSNWKTEAAKNENHSQLCKAIENAGFHLLLNETKQIEISDTSIYLIGVENWGHPPFPQYAKLNTAIQNVPEESFKILLSHDPAHWEAKILPETDIHLTLSGHTHGAQTGLHIAGIEFSPMFFVQKLWGGLYKSKNQYLYVNRGLGCVGLLGRIDMRPEITVIKLLSDVIETD